MVRQITINYNNTYWYIVGSNFTVEHLELKDITSLLIDTIKDDDEWKPNKIEETIFFMTRKSEHTVNTNS